MNTSLSLKKLTKKNRVDNFYAGLMLMPTLIIFAVVVFFPIAKGVVVSFCDYKLATLNNPFWNNLENYKKIFEHGKILTYFLNTFVYVFLTVAVQLCIGMGIALLVNSVVIGKKVLRGLYLIPWTIPSVVVAILWKWMFQQQFGVINYLLFKLNITSTINIAWTQSGGLALASIVIAAVWRQLPYMIVMLLAGLQSVDRSLVEEATIEGASSLQIFHYVTIPSIKPILTTAVWISILDNFQMFTIIYNMTGGGPLDATTTLSIAAYKKAFVAYNFGEGAAIGMLWMVFLIAATVIYNKINSRYAVNYM